MEISFHYFVKETLLLEESRHSSLSYIIVSIALGTMANMFIWLFTEKQTILLSLLNNLEEPHNSEFWSQGKLALPIVPCTALNNLCNLIKPQFPYLKKNNISFNFYSNPEIQLL